MRAEENSFARNNRLKEEKFRFRREIGRKWFSNSNRVIEKTTDNKDNIHKLN